MRKEFGVRKTNHRILLVVSLLAFLTLRPGYAQDAATTEDEEYSDYNTYSLFLVCDKEWLKNANKEKLQHLYEEFLAFGDAIGERHLAIWLVDKGNDNGEGGSIVDINKHVAYCTANRLRPSKSPYILVSTKKPNKATRKVKSQLSVQLGGHSPQEISDLLSELNDQLILEELSQENLDTRKNWLKVRSAFNKVLDGALVVVSNVKVTLEARGVKATITSKD